MHTSSKHFLAALSLAVIVLAGTVSAPSRAEASLPVIDFSNIIQTTVTAVNTAGISTLEYVLNGLAWEVANMAIESITASTVNWINSGFQGSPAFVTDLKQNLRGVEDAIAARFFEELSNQEIQTTPTQDRILDAVRLGYYLRTSPESFYTRYPSTLYAVSPNPEGFLGGDFSQGGWNAWFATVMNPRDNPYAAEELLNRELEGALAEATGNRLQELSWNRGFLQWCGDEISAEEDAAEQDTLALGQTDRCVGKVTRTPGIVIEERLNQALGSGMERLTVADDFNEIVGALLNQLAMQVLGGGNGGGLLGASAPSAGGGPSFIERTRSGGQGSAGLSTSFIGTLENQRRQIVAFQTNWEKIQTAAEAALQACGTNGNPNPQQVLDRADARLVRAANALAALDALIADINTANTAGGNQAGALSNISRRYGELMTSDILPTPEEVAEGQVESQDTGDAEPGSLYTRMTRMAASPISCRSSGN